MRGERIIPFVIIILFVLACGGDPPPPEEPTYPPCSCVKTDTLPTGEMFFACDKDNKYEIPYSETLGNPKTAERVVDFQCKCDHQPPPLQSPRPALFICSGETRPKWHVFTNYARHDGTLCTGTIKAYLTVSCIKNKFLKSGDEITMCGSDSFYLELFKEEQDYIKTNYTWTKHAADGFHCETLYPGQSITYAPYWILKRK